MDNLMNEEIVFLAGVGLVISGMVLIGLAAWLFGWFVEQFTSFRVYDLVNEFFKRMGV